MKFVLVGTWKGEDFEEYVARAVKTLSEHATGYEGVKVIARYYAIGERKFFSICETESGQELMKVVAPYLDMLDIEAIPVLEGSETIDIWKTKK